MSWRVGLDDVRGAIAHRPRYGASAGHLAALADLARGCAAAVDEAALPVCSAWRRESNDRCAEAAEYVITMTCPRHGSFTKRACVRCTADTRSMKARCARCRMTLTVAIASSR